MKAGPLLLWLGGIAWLLALDLNFAGVWHVPWWILLAPCWLGGAVLVGIFLLTIGVTAFLEVASWLLFVRENRRRERERKAVLRSLRRAPADGQRRDRQP